MKLSFKIKNENKISIEESYALLTIITLRLHKHNIKLYLINYIALYLNNCLLTNINPYTSNSLNTFLNVYFMQTGIFTCVYLYTTWNTCACRSQKRVSYPWEPGNQMTVSCHVSVGNQIQGQPVLLTTESSPAHSLVLSLYYLSVDS